MHVGHMWVLALTMFPFPSHSPPQAIPARISVALQRINENLPPVKFSTTLPAYSLIP